jgi:phospholipid transport system substrate-binding protein
MATRAVLLLTALLTVASTAAADPPRMTTATDELRRNLGAVMTLTQSPSFRTLERPRRLEGIRAITDRLFNWPEIAKRALGSHWRERSAAERRTVADWFAGTAERAYAGSLDHLGARHLPADAIRFLGETASGPDTVVRTALTYPRELPVDFVMSRRVGRWEVCDVRVDGVSVAENYRAQFDRVMGSGSFPALVERMTGKTAAAASP